MAGTVRAVRRAAPASPGLPILLVALALAWTVAAATPADAAAPTVAITSPTAGSSFDTTTYIVTLAGTSTNGGDNFVQVYLNGVFVQNLVMNSGAFSGSLVLVSGSNVIAVSDTNADGTETATVTVTSTRNPNDIRVNMAWDDGNSDVDLYIFAPASATKAAEVIWYGNKTGTNGGTLDVDNVTGYGPENIAFPVGTAPTGLYYGAVNLYARGGADRSINVRVTIFLNEGSTSQTVTALDTVVVTTPNFGGDVRNGQSPTNVNSASTIFFAFNFGSTVTRAKAGEAISYPNPFRPGLGTLVTLKDQNGTAIDQVKIYSMDGRVIRTLPGDGNTQVTWDGRNAQGNLVGSGSYLIQILLKSGTYAVGRMTLVR